MRTFEKWDELANKNCMVVIKHALFDEQRYDCDELQVINDERRIGVVIKGRNLFAYKQDVEDFWMYDNAYMVKDKMMKITIVNKM